MIYSFDIFDTCLTRRVAAPAEVFDRMSARLGLGEDFRFHRQQAEIEATRRIGHPTLSEIYEVLCEWRGWNRSRGDQILETELAEERLQLVPVIELRTRISDLHEHDTAVHYVSDMYLPSRFLKEILEYHGFWRPGDTIWVSCEARKSKSSGTLFKQVTAAVGSKDLEHTGNDARADVRCAITAGVQGRHFTRANLSNHEERMVRWPTRLGSRWAAASRQARLSMGGCSEHQHAIATVSAGVAGPLFLAYVCWILDRAESLGLERIYFFARDGQILHRIFEKVAEAKGSSIEARYFHGSRIALRFPRHFPMTEADERGAFQGDGHLPVEVVALRLGIDTSVLEELLPKSCVSGDRIPRRQFENCLIALRTENACRILNKTAATKASLLRRYLIQEGMTDETNFGICDLGWAGSLQNSVLSALKEMGFERRIKGFYMGLTRSGSRPFDAEAFTFDGETHKATAFPWFVLFAEVFAQATHGSTLGYQEGLDGRISPCFDQPDGDNPVVSDWLTIHQKAVCDFADQVIADDSLPSAPRSLARTLFEHVRAFVFHPSRTEAEAWGNCRFSSHGAATTKIPLAPAPRSPRDLLWLFGIRRFGSGNALWPQGASSLLPDPLPHATRTAFRIRNRLRPQSW